MCIEFKLYCKVNISLSISSPMSAAGKNYISLIDDDGECNSALEH